MLPFCTLNRGYDAGEMVLDLDFFKSMNETYSHGAGVKVVALTANTLQKCFRMEECKRLFLIKASSRSSHNRPIDLATPRMRTSHYMLCSTPMCDYVVIIALAANQPPQLRWLDATI